MSMYKMNPHYQLPAQIELPDCMYNMKPVNPSVNVASSSDSFGFINGSVESQNNISDNDEGSAAARTTGGSGNRSSVTKTSLPNSSPSLATTSLDLVPAEKLEAIEERQAVILSKLAGLQLMITNLHEQECANFKRKLAEEARARISSSNNANLAAAEGVEDDFADIVINADPNRPPYAILFFYKLLQQVYGQGTIIFRTHVHSSVATAIAGATNKNIKYLGLFNNNVSGVDSEKKRIIITVIWKTLAHDAELLITPNLSQQIIIYGEENISRFLSRILPWEKYPKINYDHLDYQTLIRVDSFLDFNHLRNLDALELHLISLNGGNKSHVGLVSEFLAGGKEPTIADFVIYSIAAQKLIENEQLLAKYTNVLKWLWCCQQFSGFSVFEI